MFHSNKSSSISHARHRSAEVLKSSSLLRDSDIDSKLHQFNLYRRTVAFNTKQEHQDRHSRNVSQALLQRDDDYIRVRGVVEASHDDGRLLLKDRRRIKSDGKASITKSPSESRMAGLKRNESNFKRTKSKEIVRQLWRSASMNSSFIGRETSVKDS